jgi:hypothetical protein
LDRVPQEWVQGVELSSYFSQLAAKIAAAAVGYDPKPTDEELFDFEAVLNGEESFEIDGDFDPFEHDDEEWGSDDDSD